MPEKKVKYFLHGSFIRCIFDVSKGATGATLKNLTITKMMTLGNLINNLEANNIPYYVQDGRNPDRVQIGVPTQGGDVYYWYEFWMFDGEEVTHDSFVSFVQRYNRTIGTRLCSYRVRDRFEDALRTRKVKHLRKRGEFDHLTFRSAVGVKGVCSLIANFA